MPTTISRSSVTLNGMSLHLNIVLAVDILEVVRIQSHWGIGLLKCWILPRTVICLGVRVSVALGLNLAML